MSAEDPVLNALTDVHEGMVTRYVAVVESVTTEGHRVVNVHAGPDLMLWDMLGLLAVGKLEAETQWMDDEEEIDDER